MNIHPLHAGHIVVKEAFLHARTGIRRRLDLLVPGPWAPPIPIRAWLIEHGDERILVDAGELADPKDSPFARHHVTADDELPHALAAIGRAPRDVTQAVVTHLHPDHYNGTVHVEVPVLVHDAEWADATSRRGRIVQRLSGAPLPDTVDFRTVELDHGPFGAFDASRTLTADGRVMLVSTPGHTTGHTSVIAVDDDGRHVLLAGDATDTLEQLRARRADAIAPKPEIQRETIDRILAHGRAHPTVYLPTHDPESAARLESGATL